MSAIEKFADELVLELRRRRWVLGKPSVRSNGAMSTLTFDFTCPCGRLITESIAFDDGCPFDNQNFLWHWVDRAHHELEAHVTEDFGPRP